MPAPRRYSRAQEDAILALHARGMSSREISDELAGGYESLGPCDIPDRSVRYIIQRVTRSRPTSDPHHDPDQQHRRNARDNLLSRLRRAERADRDKGQELVETVPYPQPAKGTESGSDLADGSQQIPPGYLQAWVESPEESSQAQNPTEAAGGI